MATPPGAHLLRLHMLHYPQLIPDYPPLSYLTQSANYPHLDPDVVLPKVSSHRLKKPSISFCPSFARGSCQFGENCNLNHINTTAIQCKHQKRGHCKFGSDCFFKHDITHEITRDSVWAPSIQQIVQENILLKVRLSELEKKIVTLDDTCKTQAASIFSQHNDLADMRKECEGLGSSLKTLKLLTSSLAKRPPQKPELHDRPRQSIRGPAKYTPQNQTKRAKRPKVQHQINVHAQIALKEVKEKSVVPPTSTIRTHPSPPNILVLHRSHAFPLHVSNTTRVHPPDLCSIDHTPTNLKLEVTIQKHRENSQPSTSRPSRALVLKQPTPDFPLVSCLEYVTEERSISKTDPHEEMIRMLLEMNEWIYRQKTTLYPEHTLSTDSCLSKSPLPTDSDSD